MSSGPWCWCQGPSCQLVASLLLVGAPPSRRRLVRLFTPGFHPRAVQRLTKSRPPSQLISLRQPDGQDYRLRDQDCFTTSNEIVLLHLVHVCLALLGWTTGQYEVRRSRQAGLYYSRVLRTLPPPLPEYPHGRKFSVSSTRWLLLPKKLPGNFTFLPQIESLFIFPVNFILHGKK